MKPFVLQFTCQPAANPELISSLTGALTEKPWHQGQFQVRSLENGNSIQITCDAAWVVESFGSGKMNAAMRLEEIFNRICLRGSKLEIDWGATDWIDVVIPMESKPIKGKQWLKWAIGILAVGILVAGITPLIWLWGLKKEAEKKLELIGNAVENVENELIKQGKRLDVVYAFLTKDGVAAWDAVGENVAKWWESGKDSTSN